METVAWAFLEYWVWTLLDFHLPRQGWLKKVALIGILLLQIGKDGIEEGWIEKITLEGVSTTSNKPMELPKMGRSKNGFKGRLNRTSKNRRR